MALAYITAHQQTLSKVRLLFGACTIAFVTACGSGEKNPTAVALDAAGMPGSASAPSSTEPPSVLFRDVNGNRQLDSGEQAYPAVGTGRWDVIGVIGPDAPSLVYQSIYLGLPFALTNSRLRPTTVSPIDTLYTLAQQRLGHDGAKAYVAYLFSRSIASLDETGFTPIDAKLFTIQQALLFWYLFQFQVATGQGAPAEGDALLLLKLLQDKSIFDNVPTQYTVDQLLTVLRATQASINFLANEGLFPEDACEQLITYGFKCM